MIIADIGASIDTPGRALTVSVLDPRVDDGAKSAVMPSGRPEIVRFTSPSNPWLRTILTVLAARPPEKTVRSAGHVVTAMSRRVEAELSADQYASIVKAHPLGLGQAADVANAAAFLLSAASRWITGTTLVVDGGYTAQ